MLVIFVLLLLAAMLGYPYWSAAISRALMLRRLAQTCREKGIRFRPLRKPLWWIRNRGGAYDLLLESKTQLLAVKLWSAYRRDGILVITRDGRATERRQAPVLLDVRRNAKGAKSEIKGGRIRRTRSPISPKEQRPLTKLLLVYPSYREIRRQTAEGEISLHSWDPIFDKLLVTPSALTAFLENEFLSKDDK